MISSYWINQQSLWDWSNSKRLNAANDFYVRLLPQVIRDICIVEIRPCELLFQAATHLTELVTFLLHTFYRKQPSLVCFRLSYSSWLQHIKISLSHSQFVVMRQLHISPSCFIPDDMLLLNSAWESFCPLIRVTMQLKENTSWWQLTSRPVEALSGTEKASESAAIDTAYAEWEGKNILMVQIKGYLTDVKLNYFDSYGHGRHSDSC